MSRLHYGAIGLQIHRDEKDGARITGFVLNYVNDGEVFDDNGKEKI